MSDVDRLGALGKARHVQKTISGSEIQELRPSPLDLGFDGKVAFEYRFFALDMLCGNVVHAPIPFEADHAQWWNAVQMVVQI